MNIFLMLCIAVFAIFLVTILGDFLRMLQTTQDDREQYHLRGLALDAFKNTVEMFWRMFYINPRNSFRAWRCERARQYLLNYDPDWRMSQASLELVRRRNEFYANGGDPSDPGCPTWFDVLDDFKVR